MFSFCSKNVNPNNTVVCSFTWTELHSFDSSMHCQFLYTHVLFSISLSIAMSSLILVHFFLLRNAWYVFIIQENIWKVQSVFWHCISDYILIVRDVPVVCPHELFRTSIALDSCIRLYLLNLLQCIRWYLSISSHSLVSITLSPC